MARHPTAWLVVCGLASLALAVAVSLPTDLAAANKVTQPAKKPIRYPKFDPAADKVNLFDAVDAGQVTVRLIPNDAMSGTVLIENKTEKPLTVKIPDAVVGISIHAQIGNNGFGNNGFGNNGIGNNAGANNGQGNMGAGQQMQGGGVGMNQQNGQPGIGQQNGPGNPPPGFFSVPAEKIISLSFTSVCLEHGKPEPNSSSKYTLVPVSRVSKDAVLYQLLAKVGTGKVDAQAAQAAAWHLTDKMSFEELADKMNIPLGGLGAAPYFSREQILGGKQLLAEATERVAEEKPAEKSETNVETSVKLTKSARATSN